MFCPYCGTDNRPLAFRPVILACPHMFHESEGFCFRCGDCRDGRPSAAQREAQASIAKNMMGLGILAIGVASGVQYVHTNRITGNQYIASWYEEGYDVDGKHFVRGDDYVSWAQMGGSAICALGVLALMVSRFNGRKRKVKKS